MLRRGCLVPDLSVDQLEADILGAQAIHPHPGAHLQALTQTELPLAAPIDVEFQAVPAAPDVLLPLREPARRLIIVPRDMRSLLDERHVVACGVLFHHAAHAECRCAGTDRLLHNAAPAMRNAFGVALEERGDDLLFEQAIQREAIGFSLGVLIVVLARFTDSPAIFAVVALGPPAIEDAATGLTVERRLLPAGAAGFVGADGIIQPEVGAGDEIARHVDIIVLQENDLPAKLVAARNAVDLLNQGLARFVGGVRLAREDDLHRALRIEQDAAQAFHIAKDERGAFVGGEAAREADKQRVGIEHMLEFLDLERPFAEPQMLPRVGDQFLLAHPVRLPQLFVGKPVDMLIPECLFVDMAPPVFIQVAPEKLVHLWSDPRKRVDAVSDVADGHLIHVDAGPEELPHLARNAAVQAADAVVLSRQREREHGHTIGRPPAMILARHLQKLVAVQAELAPVGAKVSIDQVVVESIVTGGHGRMRGKECIGRDDLARLIEAQPLRYQFATALKVQESGVSLIEMPGCRRNIQRSQCAHAADTQHDLLCDTNLAVPAVEARQQFAIPGRVGSDICIHQVERDAAHHQLPDFSIDAPARQVDTDDHFVAGRADGWHGGNLRKMQLLVEVLLPALARDTLLEVALRIEKANADEGQAEVAGLFAVVAGQNTQAAGVDREGFVQAKLRREVSDGLIDQFRVGACEPGFIRPWMHVMVEIADYAIVLLEIFRVGGGFLQTPRLHLAEKAHRIVSHSFPEIPVKCAIEGASFGMPAPPEIVCQFIQPVDTSRHDREDCYATIDFHRGGFPFLIIDDTGSFFSV